MGRRTVKSITQEAGATIVSMLLALGAAMVVATLLVLAIATIAAVILMLVESLTLAGGRSPAGRSSRYKPSVSLLSRW